VDHNIPVVLYLPPYYRCKVIPMARFNSSHKICTIRGKRGVIVIATARPLQERKTAKTVCISIMVPLSYLHMVFLSSWNRISYTSSRSESSNLKTGNLGLKVKTRWSSAKRQSFYKNIITADIKAVTSPIPSEVLKLGRPPALSVGHWDPLIATALGDGILQKARTSHARMQSWKSHVAAHSFQISTLSSQVLREKERLGWVHHARQQKYEGNLNEWFNK
jgi:hypothetical protein